MSSLNWRPGGARLTDAQVNAMVARARADISEILADVLNDEAGLASIYAMHGRPEPARPLPAAGHGGGDDDESGQVGVVCDRIAMLESALAQAARADASRQAGMYLGMGRRFLFELRSGLAGRNLSAADAFRLITSVRHDLREADSTLRRELQLPLGRGMLTKLAESRELVADLAGQVDSLDGQVMKLFGRSGQASAVPVPQH
jgi:hypothetical protein